MLNLIVLAYLDFAELQAKRRKAMYMQNWITKLDDFLRLGGHDELLAQGGIFAQLHRAQYSKS